MALAFSCTQGARLARASDRAASALLPARAALSRRAGLKTSGRRALAPSCAATTQMPFLDSNSAVSG